MEQVQIYRDKVPFKDEAVDFLPFDILELQEKEEFGLSVSERLVEEFKERQVGAIGLLFEFALVAQLVVFKLGVLKYVS